MPGYAPLLVHPASGERRLYVPVPARARLRILILLSARHAPSAERALSLPPVGGGVARIPIFF